MDYLELLTTQGDPIPVSATLAQERMVLPENGSKASRWFTLRPKAGRVFVSVQAADAVTATVQVKLKSGAVYTRAVQTGALLGFSMLATWSTFRVVFETVPANSLDCVVAMMV